MRCYGVVSLVFLSVITFAAPPHIMNYQGKLTDADGVALNGTYTITFRIYDADTGGNLLWYQTQSVEVVNGLFDVQLDLSINGGDTLKFDRPYWIALQVESDPEMTPREKLAPVAFSFRAIYSDTTDYARHADTADYSPSSLNKDELVLGPEGTSSRIRTIVSSCSELPTPGSLTWTEVSIGGYYSFCITSIDLGPDPWYDAAAVCADLGARLCTDKEYTLASITATRWTGGLLPSGASGWQAYLHAYGTSGVAGGAYYRCCVILDSD